MYDIDNKFLVRLYNAGLSCNGIGGLLGVDPGTVQHRLRKEGVVFRDYNGECLVTHHINGDHLDNRVKNLQTMPVSEHTALHSRKECSKGRSWCSGCNKCLPNENFGANASTWNGLQQWCKRCRASDYQSHRKELLLKQKFYCQNHKSEESTRKRLWYQNHKSRYQDRRKEDSLLRKIADNLDEILGCVNET